MGKAFAIVMTLACLAGCGGTKQFVKTYPGPELPPEQLALVKPIVGIDVVSVDSNGSYRQTGSLLRASRNQKLHGLQQRHIQVNPVPLALQSQRT